MPTSQSETAAILAAIEDLRREVRELHIAIGSGRPSKVRFMTLNEAADYLHFTHWALRKRIASGDVPAWTWKRIGNSYRFDRASLDEWMEENARAVGRKWKGSRTC